MPTATAFMAFALVSLSMVLTPGPNMVYLVSRSICQGRKAGLISLAGVAAGFLFYMLCAGLGITAILLAVPIAYDLLRFAGAAYMLYLAWQAIKPGGRSPFEVRNLQPDSPSRLFSMGFITNLLNPKIAVMYISLLPQFLNPESGNILGQSMMLGAVQIVISVTVNAVIVVSAGGVAGFLATRPFWASFQRWLMASVLTALAVKMATDPRR